MKELNLALEMVVIYLQGIWLRRRYIIITAWLFCPIGWLLVFNLPPTFKADAKLYVETRSVLDPVLAGLAIRNDPSQEIELMARTLLSRPNLEKIARQTDMDITATNDQAYEQLIDHLKNEITLTSSGRENIYNISYSDPSSALALRVVQETLNSFVEGKIGNASADNRKAAEFLDTQIKDYENRLVEAENRLSNFKKEQMNRSIGSEQDYYGRIEQQRQRLTDARLQERQLKSQLDNARMQLEGEEPVAFDSGSAAVGGFNSKFDERIRQLESQLDTLLIRFTENHPDVIEIKNMIKQLQDSRDAEIAAVAQSMPQGFTGNLNQNHIYQELRLTVARLENELSSVRVIVEDSQSKLQELEDKRAIIPDIEARFAGLNRDYEMTKAKYEELVSRRDSIDLSVKAEQSSQEVQFRIIEPPRVPIKPSGPHRVAMYTGVLLAGVIFGLFMAFARSQLQPVVTSALQLRTITEFPVFGLVSHTEKHKLVSQSRKHLFYFILLSGALLSGYAAFVVNELVVGITAAQVWGWLT